MTILLFVLVLVALIVVHEFGHFVAAKLSGMRVDEFGIGYPPKIVGKKFGETEYTLNWIPFGGFVRIYGEDSTSAEGKRAFSAKPRILQALVLLAGIGMNLLFAWLLLSMTLAMGMPRALTADEITTAPDAALMVASVLPDSPADEAGLRQGDVILSATSADNEFVGVDSLAFANYIAEEAEPLTLTVSRMEESITLDAVPEKGIIAADPGRHALGVALVTVGTIPVSWWQAPYEGLIFTWEVTKQTAVGLAGFFAGILTLSADLSQVSGPVGIAGAVGTASENGLASLLSITAIISINLALINIIPIPALDGGRLLFVLIEAVTRRPIRPGIANAVNAAGFGLLILLMVVVTASDLFKIFS